MQPCTQEIATPLFLQKFCYFILLRLFQFYVNLTHASPLIDLLKA